MNQPSFDCVLLITLDDAAAQLSISRRTLEREIRKGRFPKPVKIGGLSRVPITAVRSYVNALSVEAAKAQWAQMHGPSRNALASSLTPNPKA
jgi:excisionase family DNA binding protein